MVRRFANAYLPAALRPGGNPIINRPRMLALNDTFPKTIRWAFKAYDQFWKPALPALHRHVKLRDGFAQRQLTAPIGRPADIWIQAASAGESHLAAMLMERLSAQADLRILTTTNTRQGMDILTAATARLTPHLPRGSLRTHYFPFDRPAVMQRAVASLQPRLMVLLETELWPGLLYTLRHAGIPVLMVNARLQARSLRGYRLWPALWRHLAPNRILAVSRADADRLVHLFGPGSVERMPNMKFDRITLPAVPPTAARPRFWKRHLPPDAPFVVLGSIHRAEEKGVIRIIDHLRRRQPDVIVGLFPRHMHRIEALGQRLQAAGLPWCRRSLIGGPIANGSVIIADVFGELAASYEAATTAFVGGSLKPLGGHNFLEPLLSGITPVIGPHWRAFEWVGTELFRKQMVHVAADWRQAARQLLEALKPPLSKIAIQRRAVRFCERHRGGTEQACRAIHDFLDDHGRDHPA